METPDLSTIAIQVVGTVMTVVIIPTIPLVYRLVKAYFESKVRAIEDRSKRELVDFDFKRLDFLVANTVDEIAQTASHNSGLSDEEKKKRRSLAFSRIKSQLSDSNKLILQTAVKDLDRYIITKIEASRFFQKTLDQKDT